MVDNQGALALLHRFGFNSFSTCLLYDGVRRYQLQSTEGFVGYFDSKKILVAVGEPVCARADYGSAAEEFCEFGARQGKGSAFIAVGEPFVISDARLRATTLQLGDDLIFDVQTYAPRGDPAKKVRSARNKAVRNGCRVFEYRPLPQRDRHLEAEFEAVSKRWLRARSRLALHLLALDLFRLLDLKRYFWVEAGGRVVAFMSCLPIFERGGYLFEDLVRDPAAPDGATELMVLEAVKTLRDGGAAMATFGLSPKIRLESAVNLSPMGAAVAKIGLAAAARMSRLHHLYHYRKKFRPSAIEPSYLWKYPADITVGDLWGIMRAFVG